MRIGIAAQETRFEGVPLGKGLRAAANDAADILGFRAGEQPSYADTIRGLCVIARAREMNLRDAAAKLRALAAERDALKMNAIEQSEVCAQTVQDLALALGVELSPCSSGCPGHLPAEGVAKLKRLRAEADRLKNASVHARWFPEEYMAEEVP